MNFIFGEIQYLFKQAGVPDFKKLPAEMAERAKFATLFNDFNAYLEAAKIQGFRWDELTYSFDNPDTGIAEFVTLALDKTTYLILLQRYKELMGGGGGSGFSVPYDLKGYLTEIDTDVIDNDYMNTRFTKYLKVLHQSGTTQAAIDEALEELHKTFATLTQEEQKFANVFLHDVQRGDVKADPNKTFRDYVTEYMAKAKDDQIHRFAITFGLDEAMLRAMMVLKLTKANIDEFGRFQKLKATVDKAKAKAYFEAVEGKKLIPPKVNIKIDTTLRDFILTGGFDISEIGKSASNADNASQNTDTSAIRIKENDAWVFYINDTEAAKFDDKKVGKWMYFFSDSKLAKDVCRKAVECGVVAEAKHSNDNTGVCCFYLNCDDVEAHKRIITYMISNNLIQKTKAGKLYDISFKLDSQTDNNEYKGNFKATIKLSDFIDLSSGAWINKGVM